MSRPDRFIIQCSGVAFLIAIPFLLHAQSNSRIDNISAGSGTDSDSPMPDRLPPRALELMAVYKEEKQNDRGFVTAKDLAWSAPYVKVAFLRTDNADHNKLYGLIADAAKQWTNAGGRFRLSFQDNGVYRTWTKSDRVPSATIRIAFEPDGSWSLIGKQAQGSNVRPGESTMNLVVDNSLVDDVTGPQDPLWRNSKFYQTILHEFGHALGIAHEQFHTQCQNDLKLDPDVLRYMAGPPNWWTVEATRLNYDRQYYFDLTGFEVRKFLTDVDGAGFVQSDTIDQESVMLYDIPPSLLNSGRRSPCLSRTPRPYRLSQMDKQAYRILYPD